jgi:6-pyruvoyltetrahydropterin/6-carboxytetrahydropterin synthase
VLLRKEFTFDAAHNLVRYHGKCEALHGHTYRLAVVLEGTPNEEGMILDFSELSQIVKERVVSRLDHSYINDVLEQPTAENIANWVWEQIETEVSRPNCRLCRVEVWETSASCAILRAEDREKKTGQIGEGLK